MLYTGAALADGGYDVLEARTLPDGLAEEVLDLLEGETGVTVFATTLEGDLQLYDSIGSDTALLTLFSRASRADLAGRTVVGVTASKNCSSSANPADASAEVNSASSLSSSSQIHF